MQHFFEYLQERGLVYQMTHEKEIIELLNQEKPFTFYLGIDPTADSLHIGHFFALRMFSLLQRQGHHGILLIGGATALVGDPTGKSDMRKMLTKEQVQHNVDEVIQLARQFIKTDGDNPAKIVNNAEWMDKFSYVDFLRTACVHMNVNKMLASEAYSSRLENGGLSFLEMGYMPIQAYDFVHLNRTYGCSVQIGGSDQWGNIVAGVELSRKMNLAEGKTTAECPDTFAITSPLLMTKEGKKMGKTESGTLWVARDKTTPYHFYQYFYNTDDADTEMLLKVFTDIPTAEIQSMCQSDIREAKKRMAYEVTKLVHGGEEADRAVAASASLFANGAASADVPTKEMEKAAVTDMTILDFVVSVGFLPSKGEVRRLIEQNGLSLNGEKVTDGMAKLPADKSEILLQKGKKNFLKVILK